MAKTSGGVAKPATTYGKSKMACGPTGSPAKQTMSMRASTATSGFAPAKTYAKAGRGR